MKSHGGIWEKIVSMENLQSAWRRVKRGHAGSVAVCAFEKNLEAHLDGARMDRPVAMANAVSVHFSI